jgi:hypothetical protein
MQLFIREDHNEAATVVTFCWYLDLVPHEYEAGVMLRKGYYNSNNIVVNAKI